MAAARKPDGSGAFTGLRGTPSLYLIHGSAIIKTVAFAPVTALIEVCGNTTSLNSSANEPKHVFFSFGATKVYGMKPGRSSPTPESVISTMMLKRFIASSGIPSQTIRP